MGLLMASVMVPQAAHATAQFQKVFFDKFINEHPDQDYQKFVKRKVKCLMCHQGKGGKHENAYGVPMAELLDHKADKKDVDKIVAAIEAVNKMPFDASNPTGETFGDRIAAGKLPAADDLEALKVEPPPVVIELFDGESLAGWVGSTDSYEVRDGAIHSIAGKGGNLYTENEYSDFELTFEFKLTPGANNGLGIRAPLEGDAAYAGIELQVLDDTADKYADLKPYQFHGSAYGIAPAKTGHLKPVGEWNEQTVRCEGRQITVTLNGTVILDIDLDKVAPGGKTIDGNTHPGLSRTSGHIGFLGHGDEVAFRNLKLVEIDNSDDEEADDEDE
jgi:hypothetical protein